MAPRSRDQLARTFEKSLGDLTTVALTTMEGQLPWFRELAAEHRAWIGSVVHGGIASFSPWLRRRDLPTELTSDVFGVAPQALTHAVTLQQTVAMVRTAIEVVESEIGDLYGPEDAVVVRESISLYAREVAFAAADVYARAAEARGAWDARLEALVVDSALRGDPDDELRSRAAAVGWSATGRVAVLIGHAPGAPAETERAHAIDLVHRAARLAGMVALCSAHGDRLVVILGDVDDLDKAGVTVVDQFGPGPVVVGPYVPDLLSAHVSARAATAAMRAAPGWADAPRPVLADDLLVERALAGDGHARHSLIHDVYNRLRGTDPTVLDTLAAYLETGSSLEATSRALFVHVNTVRYRLRKVDDLTALDASDPRDAYTLRVAITLGRLHVDRTTPGAL